MNDEKSRPAIANDLSELKNCDTIYIGYPIWWGTAPRIIQTLLESYDLSGKNIYLFCTSGSSGVERSVTDLQKLYLKLNIQSGKRFAANSSENAIQTWLNSLN